MLCDDVRDRLLRAPEEASAEEAAVRHLESCPRCRRFAERLDLAHGVLAGDDGRPPVRPDAGFSARVLERLPERQPTDLLGWAALRLLPPAFASALALAVWCVWATPAPETLWSTTAETSEAVTAETDLMAWVLDADLDVDSEVGAETPEAIFP